VSDELAAAVRLIQEEGRAWMVRALEAEARLRGAAMTKADRAEWDRAVKLARYCVNGQGIMPPVSAELILAADKAVRGEAPPSSAHEGMTVASSVGSRTLEPTVTLTWGHQEGEMSPAEATDHALAVLEAANVALTDAFLWRFLRDKVFAGRPLEEYGAVMVGFLADWKAFREQFRSPGTGGPVK
jgi:hypothetical protein